MIIAKIFLLAFLAGQIMKFNFALRRASALAFVGLAAVSPARAEVWRFCVGVAPAAHESVITDVFASDADSARLERRMEAYFRGHNGRALTFQCPRGYEARVEALNAQTAALQFNRQLGFAVGGLNAAEVSAIVAAGS